MKRRGFLELGVAGAAGAVGVLNARASGLRPFAAVPPSDPIPRRALGRTGESLSVVGLGGMTLSGESPDEASRLIRTAIDAGVNYFDVAPSYGNAEELLGPALEPFRKGVFLACKTLERTRDGARAELERSLRRLRTDRLDLYQFHALQSAADVEAICGPGGALETFVAARKAGAVRFIGFSAHSSEAALLMMDRFDFDTVLFPVNYVCYLRGSFGPAVVARAREKGMGILAIKALARTAWGKDEPRTGCPKCWYRPIADPAEQALAFRFTLSRPVTAAVPPGDKALFARALELARDPRPLDPAEEADLGRRAAAVNPLFEVPART